MLFHVVKDANNFGRILDENVLLKTLSKHVHMVIVFFVLFSVLLKDLVLLLILAVIIAVVLLYLIVWVWYQKVKVFLNKLVSVLTVKLMSPLVMKIPEVVLVIKFALVKFLEGFHMETVPYMIKVLWLCFEDLRFLSWTNIALYVHYLLSKLKGNFKC